MKDNKNGLRKSRRKVMRLQRMCPVAPCSYKGTLLARQLSV